MNQQIARTRISCCILTIGWDVHAMGEATSILVLIVTGAVTFGLAAIVLGVLDKATIQRLMRRQA